MLAVALISLTMIALTFLAVLLDLAFGGPEKRERRRRTSDLGDGAWWRDG